MLEDEGSLPSDIMLLRSVDVRYFGQEYTVTVPVSSRVDQVERSQLRERFDAAYAQRYGHADPHVPAQIVTLRLAAIGNVAKPELSALARSLRRSGGAVERAPGLFRERPRHGRDAGPAARGTLRQAVTSKGR